MSAGPELVLLTAVYPFGTRSEPFLEAEVEVLAERFRRIHVLPSHRQGPARAMPDNFELVEMEWLEQPDRRRKLRALASREAARVLLWTLRTPGDVRPYLASRTYLDLLAQNILKHRSLARFVRERGLGDAIFYDYWFENSTLALALLRASGEIRTAVCRAHRFDIYDEAWGGRPVPFRAAKAHELDRVFPVSGSGAAYLAEHVPQARGKLEVRRLGVRDPGRTCPAPAAGDPPLIVSCARLIPRKRIHLIPEVLERIDRPLRWVHFGDGPERARVEAAASQLLPETTWELRGDVANREVLRFYEQNHVTALLSLSVSEGVPVSMMEAQAYGIPVVGCAVGGVPEIVDAQTGILLHNAANSKEIATGLETALKPERFDPSTVRGSFRARFDANINYKRFAGALIELHVRRAR